MPISAAPWRRTDPSSTLFATGSQFRPRRSAGRRRATPIFISSSTAKSTIRSPRATRLSSSFPTAQRDVRLVSNTFVPARIGLGDRRELGVSLYGLAFAGSDGEARRVPLDDPRLAGGLHSDEATVGAHWRWTKGELALDPQFWAGLTGPIALFVNHNAQATRQWIPPARPAEVVPVKSKSKQRLYSIR
jgi:hypothetical protein